MDAVVRYLLSTPNAMRFRNGIPDDDNEHLTNEAMVDQMVLEKCIKTKKIELAFRKVDRAIFVPESEQEASYSLLPLRDGLIHISAPPMYATVLENLLPLEKGMNFLNIGSGTGYLNSLVWYIVNGVREGEEQAVNRLRQVSGEVFPGAEAGVQVSTSEGQVELDVHLPRDVETTRAFTGRSGDHDRGQKLDDQHVSLNHGVEIWSSTIRYAEEAVRRQGLTAGPQNNNISFFKANIFSLDTDASAKYDRIYLGSCAPSSLKHKLYELLEIGGVLVGPFALKKGQQMLRRVTRKSRTEFETVDLETVQFAVLLEPVGGGGSGAGAAGLTRITTGVSVNLNLGANALSIQPIVETIQPIESDDETAARARGEQGQQADHGERLLRKADEELNIVKSFFSRGVGLGLPSGADGMSSLLVQEEDVDVEFQDELSSSCSSSGESYVHVEEDRPPPAAGAGASSSTAPALAATSEAGSSVLAARGVENEVEHQNDEVQLLVRRNAFDHHRAVPMTGIVVGAEGDVGGERSSDDEMMSIPDESPVDCEMAISPMPRSPTAKLLVSREVHRSGATRDESECEEEQEEEAEDPLPAPPAAPRLRPSPAPFALSDIPTFSLSTSAQTNNYRRRRSEPDEEAARQNPPSRRRIDPGLAGEGDGASRRTSIASTVATRTNDEGSGVLEGVDPDSTTPAEVLARPEDLHAGAPSWRSSSASAVSTMSSSLGFFGVLGGAATSSLLTEEPDAMAGDVLGESTRGDDAYRPLPGDHSEADEQEGVDDQVEAERDVEAERGAPVESEVATPITSRSNLERIHEGASRLANLQRRIIERRSVPRKGDAGRRPRVDFLPDMFVWNEERHRYFPKQSRDAVLTILQVLNYDNCRKRAVLEEDVPTSPRLAGSELRDLLPPKEIWLRHILPCCNKYWFLQPEAQAIKNSPEEQDIISLHGPWAGSGTPQSVARDYCGDAQHAADADLAYRFAAIRTADGIESECRANSAYSLRHTAGHAIAFAYFAHVLNTTSGKYNFCSESDSRRRALQYNWHSSFHCLDGNSIYFFLDFIRVFSPRSSAAILRWLHTFTTL
eukprot:g7667.t1